MSVTLVAKKLQGRPKPARQWEISIILAASYAVPVVGPFGEKLSIMYMEKFTARRIIWFV